ncbi:MAG: hypothetical protein NXH85_00425 [Pseudomonadaceae bacterium]|nr:hypothetical protein [Pseudomonadaceae bacterium]
MSIQPSASQRASMASALVLAALISQYVSASPAPAGAFHEDNPRAVAAFRRFQEIAEPATADLPRRESISANQCVGILAASCVRWVQTNRRAALTTVPNSEDYWRAYGAYLKTSPIGAGLDDFGLDTSGLSQDHLIEAATGWPIHQLAKHGHIDSHSAAGQLRDVRHMSARSSVLIDRMIFTALIGIKVSTVNVALAQAIANNDEVAIQALLASIEPMTARERSFRATFEGEAQYSGRLLAAMGDMSDPLTHYEAQLARRQLLFGRMETGIPEPQLLTGLELEERKAELQAERQLMLEAFALFADVSELSPTDYWGDHELWRQAMERVRASPWPPYYPAYLNSVAQLDIQLAVARGLAEQYMHPHPNPIPQSPPPEHFAWDWRESTSELCLQPTSVNEFVEGHSTSICLPSLAELKQTEEKQ